MRIREQKERRIRMNRENVKAIREVPVRLWVTGIMSYLDVNEALKLGQVCVFFNQIVRSPLFLKFFITLKERTKIDVNVSYQNQTAKPDQQLQPLVTFNNQQPGNESTHGQIQSQHSSLSHSNNERSGGGQRKRKMSHQHDEDKLAQIELLQTVKTFLTEQVKQSEQKLQTNMKDISILKDMLKIEKNMNSK
mmetsp:Transcript_18399/g.31459  ORF Transcript_18399/g.31459 Transcript_18399/m.31459 type:complete len:192 (+) Transcript_18399:234-809(+)